MDRIDWSLFCTLMLTGSMMMATAIYTKNELGSMGWFLFLLQTGHVACLKHWWVQERRFNAPRR